MQTPQPFPAAVWVGTVQNPNRWQAVVITEPEAGCGPRDYIWRGGIHPTMTAALRAAEKHADKDIT